MLSDHERETLAAMECQIGRDDPDFARSFRAPRLPRISTDRWRESRAAGASLAILFCIVMLAANAGGPALFFAALAWYLAAEPRQQFDHNWPSS